MRERLKKMITDSLGIGGSADKKASEDGDVAIYNQTKKIAYTEEETLEKIDEIIDDMSSGDEFKKRIEGKLVNYNAYNAKMGKRYAELMETGKSSEEALEILKEERPAIVEALEE